MRESVTFEGQAAIELEQLAGDTRAAPYPWRFGDGAALVRAVHDDLAAGRGRAEIAAGFHEAIAAGSAAACSEAAEPGRVVLSGGSFQNLRLLASTRRRLEAAGFEVLVASRGASERCGDQLRPGGRRSGAAQCLRWYGARRHAAQRQYHAGGFFGAFAGRGP